MTLTLLEHPAVPELTRFLARMKGWEIHCQNQSRVTPDTEQESRAQTAGLLRELRAVFEETTTTQGDPPRGVQFQYPPEYDDEKEMVISVTPIRNDEVEIETKQGTGFRLSLVYRMKLVGTAWKVDERVQLIGGRRRRINL